MGHPRSSEECADYEALVPQGAGLNSDEEARSKVTHTRHERSETP